MKLSRFPVNTLGSLPEFLSGKNLNLNLCFLYQSEIMTSVVQPLNSILDQQRDSEQKKKKNVLIVNLLHLFMSVFSYGK